MARIAGIDLPRNKKIEFALTYIHGIGSKVSSDILDKVGIDKNIRVHELNDEQVILIRNEISNYDVEGELRSVVGRNIKRLMDIGTYRGTRHKKGLPSRGQNTKNNSRTRKGKKKTVAGKKGV
ncbi:MAG: 30S ribosomal protein S13 [Candidatus Marinimicrobia bacterium]|nr:30S ribosomal protein S13 [Candidatus Neomarinimicrobiota bacterium]